MRDPQGTFATQALLCTDLTADPVWYHKAHATFSDALALVRRDLWAQEGETFCGSPPETDTVKFYGRSWKA